MANCIEILILYFHLFLEACNLHVQIFRVEKTLRSDLERIRYMFLNHINKLKFNSKCKWQKKMHVTDKSFNKLC